MRGSTSPFVVAFGESELAAESTSVVAASVEGSTIETRAYEDRESRSPVRVAVSIGISVAVIAAVWVAKTRSGCAIGCRTGSGV